MSCSPSDSVVKPAMTHAVSENRGGSLSHLGTVSGETVVVLALDAGTSLHHVHASRMWCRPLFCLVVCVPRRGVGRSECVWLVSVDGSGKMLVMWGLMSLGVGLTY